ncbi:MAG: FAD-dependent oxidoreductase [Comamonadaceae bacterium]|nr:FAD-dependent oxidoreductase [Comamonadaceae bacterium]
MNFVIIGAGPAGGRAAETLRENDSLATVTLVGAETRSPLRAWPSGTSSVAPSTMGGARQRRSLDHLQALGIRYLHGKALKVQARPNGGQVELADGTQLPYDRLLVATGSSPSLPPIPGTGLPGVVTCWTLEDAHQIAAKLTPGARVVMLGAGFVAGVCMKSLVNSGAKLSVVAGRSGQILRSMMTPVGSHMLQRWLEGRGVEIIGTGRVLGIEPGPRLVMDTRSIDADLIIMATGVHPNVSFLEGTDAEIRSGVVIDAHMRTTVPHIYAAGDVAQGRDFSTGEWVVHALQPTATEHGRVAALNMLGKDVPYRGSLSMNVLGYGGPDLPHLRFGMAYPAETTPKWWTKPTSSTPACVSMATS